MKAGLKGQRTKPRSPQGALSAPERAELQRRGAKAAARGDKASSSPMLEPVNMPPATGEAPDDWQQRQEAWQQGHDAQSGTPPATPSPTAPHQSTMNASSDPGGCMMASGVRAAEIHARMSW
jgi:hypothetical protein